MNREPVRAPLELRCFGAPRLVVHGHDSPIALQRAPALLAYLAHARQPVPRAHLAALLWPEAGAAQSRPRLRRLLYTIEEAVGDTLFQAHGAALDLVDGRLQLDQLEFAAHARAAVSAATLDDRTEQSLLHWTERAAQPLLDGLDFGSDAFDDWRTALRIEHEHLLARLLERLMDHRARLGDPDAALGLGERLRALDPYREPTCVRLMQLHAQRGDAAGVEAAFMRCADALRAEFGIKPGAATEAAYLDIVERLRRAAARAQGERFDVRFAESGYGTVAYAAIGHAREAIVIVPGFVSHIEIAWEEPQVRAFLQALARRFRVLMFDRRGIGLSERLATAATEEAVAVDVRAILDHAGIDRAWLFGSSEGGPAAIRLAVDHPERVQGLVLFGSLARGSAEPDYPWALPAPAFDRWLERLVQAWGGPTGIETFAPSGQHDPVLRAWWARMVRHATSPGGLKVILGGLREVDVRDALPRVRVPTLVMHRRGDQAVRFDAGQHLARHIPGARWLPLDGDDHWWWRGDAGRVIDAVLAFADEALSSSR